MLGRKLVLPLEEDWQLTLDDVARGRGWPTSRDVARLALHVTALSAAYNDPSRARAAVKDAGAARLGFSFARDVPKGAAAVRELVSAGALAGAHGLRILDVGAGMGATTWGVVRALEASGAAGTAEVTWVDPDTDALDVATAIARARRGKGRVVVDARAVPRGLAGVDSLARFDLVLAGQVLSELDVGIQEDVRVGRHAALLAGWLDRHVEPGGSLVVIEPALRDRSRHLHRVRDALAAQGVTIFAPCLHAAACPALARETDWCHEDLEVDLPRWLAPVARAAGLRREGLTFSYVVLRRDGATLAGALDVPASATRLRIVSGAIPTKGKREAFVCGELDRGGERVVVRARASRLDRDATEANGAWDDVARGQVLSVDPVPTEARARIGRATEVRELEPSASASEGETRGVSPSGDSESR